ATGSGSPDASATATATGSATAAASRSPSASASATASASPAPTDSPDATTYVVRAGDTLYRIALSHGVTVEQMVAWNVDRYPSLATDAGDIKVGWELVVIGDGTVPPPP